MADAWQAAYDRADQSGGNFIPLKNKGDKVIGYIVGNPHIEDQVWDDKKKQYETFTEEHKKAGKKPAAKFVMNFILLGSAKTGEEIKPSAPAMQVLTLNMPSFKNLKKARTKYGEKVWEVERQGEANDTKTFNTVMPERDLTAEEQKIIKAFEGKDTGEFGGFTLNDLREASDEDDGKTDMSSHEKSKSTNGAAASNSNGSAGATQQAPAAAPPAATEPPAMISTEDKNALVERAKKLPREKLESFLAQFKIERIGQIPAAQVETAKSLMSQLENPTVDPFA